MTTKDKRGLTPGVTNAGNVREVSEAGSSARPAEASRASDVAAFVAEMQSMAAPVAGARGRLIFAIDATMSRQPTWDLALSLQADMFQAVKDVGGLDVQLVYFRGTSECRSSKWVSDPSELARLMTTVSCRGGLTQIGRVLAHANQEARQRRINALVFIGDAFEEEIDPICQRAGELALGGVPAFLFQEGHDPAVSRAFQEVARITRGATCCFDRGSAAQLRDLLTAVAVYASGGRKALLALSARKDGGGARLLLPHLAGRG
ncbi:MAG: VWA domain-containing protein [Hyphomicrobium sp.]|nr:VWA domain-containing protein [Hyphomicrobium sp.]